jgi:hypothetical protein
MNKSNRVLLIIAIFTGLLLVSSLFLISSKDIKKLDPATPEGVVQLYLNEVINGQYEEAINYLSATSNCKATDLDRAYLADSLRINLVSSEINEESALVKIEVETQSGGPFNDSYTESHNYRLAIENTNWKILGIPWPMWECGLVTK